MSTVNIDGGSLRAVFEVLGGNDVSAGSGGDTEKVRRLRAMLEGYQRNRAQRAGWVRRFIPTGLTAVDTTLPHGGLPCGAITEVLSDGYGVGSMSLALRIASRAALPTADPAPLTCAADSPRPIVLVDTGGDFYPPAAAARGILLSRLIILRICDRSSALWVVDQSLRCRAVAAVIAPLQKLDERSSRRLQLAAESSGCLGLILRSNHCCNHSFAAVRMLIEGIAPESAADSDTFSEPATSGESLWRSKAQRSLSTQALSPDRYLCRITLLAVREGAPAGPCRVDLHHETGDVSLPPISIDRSVAKTA